jgi:hypothetical protein
MLGVQSNNTDWQEKFFCHMSPSKSRPDRRREEQNGGCSPFSSTCLIICQFHDSPYSTTVYASTGSRCASAETGGTSRGHGSPQHLAIFFRSPDLSKQWAVLYSAMSISQRLKQQRVIEIHRSCSQKIRRQVRNAFWLYPCLTHTTCTLPIPMCKASSRTFSALSLLSVLVSSNQPSGQAQIPPIYFILHRFGAHQDANT